MRHARQAQHLLRLQSSRSFSKKSNLQPSRSFSKRSNFDAGWHPATVAIHGDAWDVPLSSHEGDVAPPLGVSTTFEQSDHVYGRDTAPTRQKCEAVLGALEGGAAVLFASGLAATHAAVAAVAGRSPGRTRVAIDGGYHGTHATLKCLAALGAEVDVVPLPPPEACGATLAAGDLVWLETPKNPDCALADVAAYAHHAPCAVAVDATFAPPPAQTLLKSGADVVVHSATKYLCGHSDALAGVAATADEGLDAARFAASPVIIVSLPSFPLQALRDHRNAAGTPPGSLETWLLLRSLRTLHLRVAAQSATALDLATYLETRGDLGVRAVRYPGLGPSAALAARQMAHGGGVFAIECRSATAAQALPATLRLFRDATSLGGVESLAEWRRKYDDDVSPYLVRLSVGLEDAADLKRDLTEALETLQDPAYDDVGS